MSGPVRSDKAELEDQRRFLLDSLLDLQVQHDAGEISQDDFEALRDDYTARAADILRAIRAIDEPRPLAPDELLLDDAQPSGSRTRGGSRRAVTVAVLVVMVTIALASVLLLATNRNNGASTANPQTPAERLAYAHQLEGQGKAVDALKQYDTVLKAEPNNVEALTYRGWLLKLAGLVDQAQTTLDRAIAIDPTFPDARFFRGMLLFQDRKDPAAAIPEFEAYLASNPPAGTDQAVRSVLDQARQAIAGGAGATTTTPPTTPLPAPPGSVTVQ